jgi:O-antigen ligase
LPAILSLASDLLATIAPGLYKASDRSYDGRQLMWQGGLELFKDSPLIGLGFGGWGERIGRFTGESGLPPHNFLVAAWANSGILALLIAILFVIVSLRICWRVAAAQHSMYDRRTAVVALCAVAWVFLHGMGDNTTLYGEQHTMMLIALVYAYVYSMMPVPAAIPRKHSKPAVRHDGIKSLVLAGAAEYRGGFAGDHSPR